MAGQRLDTPPSSHATTLANGNVSAEDIHFEHIVNNHAANAAPDLKKAHTHQSTQPCRSNSMKQTRTIGSTANSAKEPFDANLDVNLPYRTLTPNANFAEYKAESAAGEIDGPLEPNGVYRYKLVAFLPNDPENPKNWSKLYKWYCTMVVAMTCFVVAFASSVITADIEGVVEDFGVSEEVALVSITLFVVGFGIGPMAFAPLSEILGRKLI